MRPSLIALSLLAIPFALQAQVSLPPAGEAGTVQVSAPVVAGAPADAGAVPGAVPGAASAGEAGIVLESASLGPSRLRDSAAVVLADSSVHLSTTVLGMLRGAGGTALVAVALIPLDVTFAEMAQDPGVQGSGALRQGASFFNAVGSPGVLLTSVGMYGAGRLTGHERLTTVGAHATQAILLSGAVTAILKLGTGRQRPFVQAGDSDDFSPGRGFSPGLTSFPSGHTTAAFAFAAAVTEDLKEWKPELARIAGPLLYAGAASVGAARMYSDRHWVSDVVMGAGIGAMVGRGLVRHAIANPDNWLDRQFRAVSILPSADGGVAMAARYSFR